MVSHCSFLYRWIGRRNHTATSSVRTSAAGTASHTPVRPNFCGSTVRNRSSRANERKKVIKPEKYPFPYAIIRTAASIYRRSIPLLAGAAHADAAAGTTRAYHLCRDVFCVPGIEYSLAKAINTICDFFDERRSDCRLSKWLSRTLDTRSEIAPYRRDH